ncbi:MAG TPA: M14 family metallopeptidase [Longimicrobiales bacterium]|nr:M14 family metallopeptidase [Longimicrobiales bacterium]
MLVAAMGSACGSATAQVGTPVPEGGPLTAAEESMYARHTSHAEMWDFLEALSATSTEMRLGSYGETRQGRSLPYAVFGRPLVAEPWEAWTLDRPVIVLAANVHGGERTFREGLLTLTRELATPGTAANALLDELVVVVAPQINPDGFEATPRGTRGNAWGIDLNRDYVKLEHPSIINYVRNVIGAWRPHLFVDGHNGGSRPYNLAYQCPSHADPAQEITLLCDQEIFPAIDTKLEAEGLKSWYYTYGNEEEWTVGGSQARIGRNYGGFVNSVAILFEAPRQELATGARAGYLGYLAVLEYAAANADRLMDVVGRARLETVAMGVEPRGEVTVEMEYQAEDYPVDYEIVVEDEEEGGERVVQVTDARLMKKPVPTKTRPRPWAYVLPRDAVDAVAMLRRHDITVMQLTEAAEIAVDAYIVEDVTHERAYNHAAATRVEVGDVVTIEERFPEGTYVVPTAQFLGRLVAHMLEPETEDNVIYWNTMDAWLPRGPQRYRDRDGEVREREPMVPIYKLMSPMALPTLLVE